MPEPKGFLVVPVGFRADGTLRALELTDSDELKVALSTATGSDLLTELEAKLETDDLELVSKIISQGPHGWVGGGWQRNPLLLGYSGQVYRTISNTDLPAGFSIQADSAVPAGEIWVITYLGFLLTTATIDPMQIRLNIGGPTVGAMDQSTPASGKWYTAQGNWILKEGDIIQGYIYNATLNDDVHIRALGYRVDLDQ